MNTFTVGQVLEIASKDRKVNGKKVKVVSIHEDADSKSFIKYLVKVLFIYFHSIQRI